MSRSELLVRGRRLEAAWWDGAPDRPPIVLLHEGLGSVGLWREFPAALARRTGRRVFAYSRFGHGRSDAPLHPHTVAFMHDEASMLPEVLAAAAIDRAVLLGHSDGASIAILAAAHHLAPESLILEAPHVFVEDLSVASIERTTAAYASGDLRARLARHHDAVDVAFRGWSDVWLDPAFRTWNLEASLARITSPCLLIQGAQDEYGTLRQLDAIERRISGPARRLVLDDCGHSPHRDQPAAVLEAVAAFLEPPGARPRM